MNWQAGRSYYIGYSSIDRFDSIIFFHNYLFTWSIGMMFSLILPLLFLFAPSSLRTTRTSHFLIICLVCLSNMLCLYIQPYILNGSGEPNLSFHICRLVVYLSTIGKPIELYLTLLFSIERILTKVLSSYLLSTTKHRQLFKKFYSGFILLGILSILSIRLYEVLNFIQRKNPISDNLRQENKNDSVLNFQYCFNSIDIATYAKILSFYLIQYWFEYIILGIISLSLAIIIIYQCFLPRFQRRSLFHLSVNTKFYLSLSACVISFELILLYLHSIVTGGVDRDNTQTQVNFLQTMLFIYNFRCILLPLIICLIICEPFKQWFYELIILRPYLDNLDETDQINTMTDRAEPFSSGLQRTFAKNTNNEQFDNDASQFDL